MEKGKLSGCTFDDGLNQIICEENLNDEEHYPSTYSNHSRLQELTQIMTPWRRLAAVSLALLAAVLLIVDISLGIRYNNLQDTHLSLDDTERITNEMTKLQHTYKTAVESINGYKKQLDSEMNRQRESNWEFEYQTKRSTDYDMRVVKMTNDIAALKNSMQPTYDDCKHCPLGWILRNSVCYYFSLSNNALLYTWQQARDFCKMQGGDLAVIDSKDKENSTVSYLQKYTNINANRGFWIGLNDMEERGTWKWLDGTTATEGFWMDGEPNNLDEEICVGVYPRLNFFKAWNDVRCDASINWICEKAPFSVN